MNEEKEMIGVKKLAKKNLRGIACGEHGSFFVSASLFAHVTVKWNTDIYAFVLQLSDCCLM
jgi:hypothetical protein